MSAVLWGDSNVKRGLLFYLIGIYCVIFGVFGVFIDISHGYYVLKIPLMVLIAILSFNKKYYSFLMGLLIPCYFMIKRSGARGYDVDYMISFSHVIVIFMGLFLTVTRFNKRKMGSSLDFSMILLISLLLFIMMTLFVISIDNQYLFTRRLVEIFGYVSAFMIGRRFDSSFHKEARMVLYGLGFGIFAFTFPWTFGVLKREGLDILLTLDRGNLQAVGAQSTAVESGIALVIFAFSCAFYLITNDRLAKKEALITGGLSAITCFFFLSKAAILSMVVVIIYLLVTTLSLESFRNKRIKVWIAIFSFVTFFITILIIYLPQLVDSFLSRFSRVESTADGRLYIYSRAIEVGSEHLAVGVGAGQFRIYSGIWHAHNDFLNMFVEHGIIAVCLFFLLYLCLCVKTFQMYKLKKDFRILAVLFGAVLISYSCYSQVEPLYFNRAGLLFMYLSGWLTVSYSNRRKYLVSKKFSKLPAHE